ncbi:MAG: glycosyltransferase family 9 protein, partial [Gemmatimonadaceae bacterium]
MPRSLVIQTSFLGDMVLTTPLIAALASAGPVDVVATPANAALLAHHPLVRHVYRYDKRGAHTGVSAFRAMARLVRCDDEADTAYLAQGSLRSAALAAAAGYRSRVGFDTSAGRFFYTKQVRYDDDRHHAERLWSLAGLGTIPAASALRPRLYPGAAEDESVHRVLAEHGYDGEPLVALAPGSVWATKRWPYYSELSRELSNVGRVVIIGGSDDAALAADIVKATRGSAIDAVGRLSLLASAALIGRARVLVTNDSAPQHLASAMNTPTISVFGPTVPSFGFGPLAEQAVVAGVEGLACRPCDRHGPQRCPLGHWRCMRELAIADIHAAI